MDPGLVTRLVEALAWPLTCLVGIVLLRHAVVAALGRLKGLEGPAGWKMLFEVRKVGDRLENLEKVTADIYSLTGEPLRVREEIYAYIAEILDRVSPGTALEMRAELNRYHLPRLGVTADQIKKMLVSLGKYEPSPDEVRSGLTPQLSPSYIQAVLTYQRDKDMCDADGIVGPKTLRLLREDVAKRADA